MKLLVITSCTAKKQENIEKCSAIDMYQGAQHLLLKEGYNNYRKHYDNLDMIIISAGYGVIEPEKEIYTYNVSFNNMTDAEILEQSNKLHITEDLNNKIKDYDIIFFLLGSNYLKSINFSKIEFTPNQIPIFFLSGTAKKSLKSLKRYYIIEAGKEEAIQYSYGIIGLKGYLFKLLCQELIDNTDAINFIKNTPENVAKEFLYKYKGARNKEEKKQIVIENIESEIVKTVLF